jgi:regulatory protein
MSSAYIDGLKMLGRRELSEAQIRQRLERREHDADEIDRAVARLKEERAIDDARVAGAMARTGASIKRRGRLRVKREIENAGIAKATASRAVDETFGELDEDALIDTALDKKLRAGGDLNDPRLFARLYRYLSGQGFQPDRAMRALSARRRSHSTRRPGTK